MGEGQRRKVEGTEKINWKYTITICKMNGKRDFCVTQEFNPALSWPHIPTFGPGRMRKEMGVGCGGAGVQDPEYICTYL